MTKQLAGSTDGGTIDLVLYAREYAESTSPTVKKIGTYTYPVAGGSSLPTTNIDYFTKTMRKADTYNNSTFFMTGIYHQPPDLEPETPVVNLDGFTNEVRCDNWSNLNSGVAGCVNPDQIPYVTYSKAIYPYIGPNIENGQATLGGVGAGLAKPLHRVTPAERDANRAVACSTARSNALPAPPADMVQPSCDEYPFASSLEGGSSTVIAWVPLAENNSQGGLMNGFYNNNRVIGYPQARDQFLVEVTP